MMDGQMKKGVLEMCLLHLVAQRESYGYDLLGRITEAFPEVQESTVYSILRRLRAEGCAEVTIRPAPGGPDRKYYRITEEGHARLRDLSESWKRLTAGVAFIGID